MTKKKPTNVRTTVTLPKGLHAYISFLVERANMHNKKHGLPAFGRSEVISLMLNAAPLELHGGLALPPLQIVNEEMGGLANVMKNPDDLVGRCIMLKVPALEVGSGELSGWRKVLLRIASRVSMFALGIKEPPFDE